MIRVCPNCQKKNFSNNTEKFWECCYCRYAVSRRYERELTKEERRVK